MTLQDRYEIIKKYASEDVLGFITRNLVSLNLNSDATFEKIDRLLSQYGVVTLSSATGNPNLKIFAMNPEELEEILQRCSAIGEISFVMYRSDLITDKAKVLQAIANISDAKQKGISYKDENGYFEEIITGSHMSFGGEY